MPIMFDDKEMNDLGAKCNDQWIVFGEVYYLTPTSYRDIKIVDLIHVYRYANAKEFDNIDITDDILCANPPVSQSKLDPR